LRFNDRDIYYYLRKKKELTPQKIDKIAKNYLRLINEADDTVKTLNDVAAKKLTPKIIHEEDNYHSCVSANGTWGWWLFSCRAMELSP
jgi:hypothetical protein